MTTQGGLCVKFMCCHLLIWHQLMSLFCSKLQPARFSPSVGSLRAFHLPYKKKMEAKSMDPRSLQKSRFYGAVFQLCCVQMTVILMNWQQKGGGRCGTGVRVLLQPRGVAASELHSEPAQHQQLWLSQREPLIHTDSCFWRKGKKSPSNCG